MALKQRPLRVVLGVAAATATVVVGWLALSPQFSAAPQLDGPLPSPVAGDAVPPIVGTPSVRIAVAGDTGTGEAAELATARRMTAESRHGGYDALLLLGDLVYEVGDADLVDRVVSRPFAPLIDNGAELLPVLGNHDYGSDEQDQILTELGRQHPWYTDRIGPVRVVVLDSNQVENADQTNWLRRTLATPQPPGTWTVVSMHHPAYSAGYHGSEAAVQQLWAPLFAEHDVPLVLAGHDHDYQRSVPQDGVTYVVSGAGARLRPTGQEEFTEVSSSTLHYLDLLFYADRVVGRTIDQQGRLVDMFTIVG